MSFTGKSTYSAGIMLPEIAEDVSDIISIISPFETPLLDAIGTGLIEARSTYHEWLEDSLLPNKDNVNDDSISSPETAASFSVANGDRFKSGDQIQIESSLELMLVTGVNENVISVIRGYAGTSPEEIIDSSVINILSNAGLEGGDKPEVRFSMRSRKGNYTQIFNKTVEVSGSNLATSQLGIKDELDYQKQERLRELIRDLENTVINGGQSTINSAGSDGSRRTMSGIAQSIKRHSYHTNDGQFPGGGSLDEMKVNFVLRKIWEESNGNVDLIVVGGRQKRAMNNFIGTTRSFGVDDTVYKNMINYYESDFGLCKIITSRWMPQDAVMFLDSSKINLLPLAGRSFHYKPLSSSGDYECGEIIGEYTLEIRNEEAHGIIRGLNTNIQ